METVARTVDNIRGAPATPTAPYSPQRRTRIDSVDLLRGLVMVIMMLDHTRDFVHAEGLRFDPTDLTRTYPILFLTRWITHFCAPTFVFLAGTGAYFQELRGKPKSDLSRFLVTRGLWLVALELTFLRVAIFFTVDYAVFLAFLQVIWVIGVSMIVLAALIHLPLKAVLYGALGVIALHNLLDGVQVTGAWSGLWKILHQPGLVSPFGTPGPTALVLYPLIPWIAVMAAGYAFGSIYRLDERQRRQILFRLGAALTIGFVVLRAINVYGDPAPWSPQKTTALTILSFLNVSKYPPSLLFLLMTLGPGMILLALVDNKRPGPIGKFLIVFGRVPMFFYLLQWVTAHTLAIVAGRLAGKPTAYLFTNLPFAPPAAPGSGFSLPMVYVLWALGVALLFPLCLWYSRLKARRHDWWLSYL